MKKQCFKIKDFGMFSIPEKIKIKIIGIYPQTEKKNYQENILRN